MTDFTLGNAPHRMTLVLSSGADFVASLTRADGEPWPAGEGNSVTIEVADVIWVGTPVGATITWDVDEADVTLVIAQKPKKARLFYTNGPTKVLWATGPVVIR